jgi:hypothetical protein
MKERWGFQLATIGVALLAASAVWIFFSLGGPDLRPTCSGRLGPGPAYGPDCFNGPRPIFAESGLLPALIVFVTVVAVVAIASRLSRGRRYRG